MRIECPHDEADLIWHRHTRIDSELQVARTHQALTNQQHYHNHGHQNK